MATSIFSRKRDLVYLVYFSIAVPMGFIVDLQGIYPKSIVPGWMSAIKDFYINTYNDRYFLEFHPFFDLYMYSELLIQLPVMIWGVRALYQGSLKVPLVLLPFSCLIFLTTATCMVEFWFWDTPLSEKIDLTTLYGPYLALSAFMLGDMYLRLDHLIEKMSAVKSETERKKLE